MSKVLVTGGAGFIGSHVVDALIGAGHDVIVADSLCTGARENVNRRARLIEVDIRSQSIHDVIQAERPEYVHHLAAQMSVTASLTDPIHDAENNILGSINVLEASVKCKVRKIIYASTAGAIYGEPSELPAPEECPAKPLSQYGLSKYTVELYIHLYHRLHGLPFTILRYPNVYGPRQTPHGEAGVCAIFASRMLQGQRPILYGHGEPVRDYVYVGDIARGNVLAMDRGDGETVNLGSQRGTTVREIFDEIRKLTGYQGEPELKTLRPGEVSRIYTTNARARTVLGWLPEVGLREGLAQTIEHIRTHR